MPSDADFAADLHACREALRGGSRTFFAASRVLPARVAGPAIALYAFCREADDIIDGGGGFAGLAARPAGRDLRRPARAHAGGPCLGRRR